MRPAKLTTYLIYAINHNYPVLIKGKPGIGKSSIVDAAALAAGADLIISHPVVSDPTDYKGLPFPSKDGLSADFLPYGDLKKLLTAKKKTVFFIDDLGQASASVQAAVMQLILNRTINGHKISSHIVFIAATNRREDKAGVSGILEPVKSRFMTILELDVNSDDWVKWAIEQDMPAELTAFIRFKPDVLNQSAPSKDIVNTASPRTLASVGKQQANNLPEELYQEVFTGAAGAVFAGEYLAFIAMAKELPSLESIIANPTKAVISKDPSVNYAIIGGLARKMTDVTIDSICKYLSRLSKEFSVACMSDATTRNPSLCHNDAYIQWSANPKNALI